MGLRKLIVVNGKAKAFTHLHSQLTKIALVLHVYPQCENI
jgi:hypothetical protein